MSRAQAVVYHKEPRQDSDLSAFPPHAPFPITVRLQSCVTLLRPRITLTSPPRQTLSCQPVKAVPPLQSHRHSSKVETRVKFRNPNLLERLDLNRRVGGCNGE
eukprot:scaffold40349_cov79-Phaeocystis_antarctica.AAC.2